MQNRKLEIITRLMPQVPEKFQQTVEQAMITWWANIRRDGGMRLTHHGYQVMHDVLKLESWQLDLSDTTSSGPFQTSITKKTVLDLDRKLEWPYYLDFNTKKKRRHIVFFGSREAMMANLYGDLKKWLDSIG